MNVQSTQNAFSNIKIKSVISVYIDESGFVVEAFRDYGYSSRVDGSFNPALDPRRA